MVSQKPHERSGVSETGLQEARSEYLAVLHEILSLLCGQVNNQLCDSAGRIANDKKTGHGQG